MGRDLRVRWILEVSEQPKFQGELASQTPCTAQKSPSLAAGVEEELILGQDMSGAGGPTTSLKG